MGEISVSIMSLLLPISVLQHHSDNLMVDSGPLQKLLYAIAGYDCQSSS